MQTLEDYINDSIISQIFLNQTRKESEKYRSDNGRAQIARLKDLIAHAQQQIKLLVEADQHYSDANFKVVHAFREESQRIQLIK